MHVKNLAARYEAVAAHRVGTFVDEGVTSPEGVGSGRVRKLTERLERAVKEGRECEKDAVKEIWNSESPRAVEAVAFDGPGGLATVVPVSVADVGASKEDKECVEERVFQWEQEINAKNGNEEIEERSSHSPKKEEHKKMSETSLATNNSVSHWQDNITTTLLDEEKSNPTEKVDESPRSALRGSEGEHEGGYASGTYIATRTSLDFIQSIEDISDDDLDNIDGVERVEDFDSQEDHGDTLHRQETVEILDGDTPPTHLSQEFSSDDIELDGYGAPPVHVEDTDSEEIPASGVVGETSKGATFPDATSSGLTKSFNSLVILDKEVITKLENIGDEDSGEEFESADEEFSHSSSAPFRNKSTSRRPRVKSVEVGLKTNYETQKLSPLKRSEGGGGGLSQDMRSGKGSEKAADRMLTISLRKLPKAKVMIARRRGQSVNLGTGESDEDQPLAHATMSMDDRGVRRLVREYSNPSELLTGQVSMVDAVDEQERKQIVGDAGLSLDMGRARRHRREDEFKKKYDEFLDAEELGGHLAREKNNGGVEDEDLNAEEKTGSSKQKYRNRARLFGKSAGKDREKLRAERQKRHAESVQRRSSMLSGALDRVSMAADPWIDFITDANTLPGGKRPFRDVMKKIFRRGRGNELIKN